MRKLPSVAVATETIMRSGRGRRQVAESVKFLVTNRADLEGFEDIEDFIFASGPSNQRYRDAFEHHFVAVRQAVATVDAMKICATFLRARRIASKIVAAGLFLGRHYDDRRDPKTPHGLSSVGAAIVLTLRLRTRAQLRCDVKRWLEESRWNSLGEMALR